MSDESLITPQDFNDIVVVQDPQVSPDAEHLFLMLRWLNRDVEFVRYPRDGHELSRSGEPRHRVDRLKRILDWFDKHSKTEK